MSHIHAPHDLEFAIRAVRRAMGLARIIQQALTNPAMAKEDKSPVTVADFAVQAMIGRALDQEKPGDKMMAEEKSGMLRAEAGRDTLKAVMAFLSPAMDGAPAEDDVYRWIDKGGAEAESRFWVMDPIDGTKGFLRREQYAIALALIEEGKVILGVLGCPNLGPDASLSPEGPGMLAWAVRGQGAWRQDAPGENARTRLRVSRTHRMEDIRLLRSVEAAHTNLDQMASFARSAGMTAAPVCMDSQAKYAVLAAGQGDIILRLLSTRQPDYKEMIWDQAAGAILVEEAGGRVTDLLGRPLDFNQGSRLEANRGVCATNGIVHDTVLDTINRIELPPRITPHSA